MTEGTSMPPRFDPTQARLTGAAMLIHGLPELPDVLTRDMTVPVAFWEAVSCAAVLFLHYIRDPFDDTRRPFAVVGTYARDGAGWSAHSHWLGHGWNHDLVANPDALPDLDGQMITGGGSGVFSDQPAPGHPAAVATGHVAPAVTGLALIQDGREDRRELQSYFGAWVICTEQWAPYQVNALDKTGAVIGSVDGPPRL